MAYTKLDETTESKSPANPLCDPGNQSGLIEDQIASAVLKATIPALLIFIALGTVAVWLGGAGHEFRYIPIMIIVLSLPAIWGLVRAGRVSFAVRAYIAALCVAILSGMILSGGVNAPGFTMLLPLVAMVGWLFGMRTAIKFAAVSVLTGGAFVWLDAQGWLHETPPPTPTMIWLASVGFLLLALAATAIPSRMLRQALLDSEARRLEAERVSRALADRERDLRENEQRFRSTLESLERVAVQVYTPDGTITFWNRGSELIYGYPASAAIGRDILELLFSPETREAERQLMDEALATGHLPAAGEVDALNKDGRKVTVYASRVLAPRSGGLPDFFCFEVDITERKRAEAVLNNLATSFAHLSGKAFFEAVCRHLATSVGVDYVFVGRLDSTLTSVTVLGGYMRGEPMGPLTYDLADTPCNNVIEKEACVYHSGVQALFPRDIMLVRMGIEGYFGTPIFDRQHKPLGILVALHSQPLDQTEAIRQLLAICSDRVAAEMQRAEADGALRIEKLFSDTLFESPRDTIFLFDPATHKPVRWNHCFVEISGYTDDEIATMRAPDDFYDAADLRKAQTAIAEIMAKGRGTVELSLATKSGQRIPFEYGATTVKVADGRKLLLAIGRDLTDRKRAEQALRESESQLANALKIAKLGHWELDIESGLFTFSDSLYAVLRTTAKEMGGYQMSIADYARRFVHPEDSPLVESETRKAIDTTDPNFNRYLEHRMLYADGSAGHIAVHYFVVKDRQGKTIKTYGVNQDITELKRFEEERVRLESQLAQAQKMEAIGTLAGGIAHDFNNILSPIVGYVELARMQAKDDPELSEYLGQVGEAASRATELVRQILTFTRKTEQQKMPLQVSSVVEEALKLLRSSIPTSIEIRQEIATQALVLADSTRIHQVVMNLCTNAYQVMEGTGGVLAVSLKETEIPQGNILGDEISPGRYVVLAVSDTGCGMDKETQEKIFDPYFTTKETGKGTGLGLAVVHGIVKDHQGVILVDSEPGKGTTFQVYLPVTEDLKHAAHAKQEETTPTKGHEHILFVDDEELICRMAKKFLARYGYAVDVCSNGRDALFVIEQDLKAYDLLITDMTIPGINGKELAKKVLALRPDLPVILCTGYSSLIDREEATRIGIRGYMEKPLVMYDLVGKIKEVLAR
jgi:PAS domain S-box-containing protein